MNRKEIIFRKLTEMNKKRARREAQRGEGNMERKRDRLMKVK